MPLEEISVLATGLRLRELKITIPKGPAEFLIAAYVDARALYSSAGARFFCDPDDQVTAEVGGVRARLETKEDVEILHEQFVARIYNFACRGAVVVWDIGMNTGFASLFFARNAETHVIGFEPSRTTYEKALRNFSLNPHLSGRIRAFNSGIGDSDSVRPFYSNSARPTVSGLYPIPESLAPERFGSTEQVTIQRASSVLRGIRENFPDRKIFAKIDCEGSEYQIIRELCKSNAIQLLDWVALEWHRREENQDPAVLADLFLECGFRVFLLGPERGESGMLYATR